MADTYASFGRFLLLKQRAQDGLGTLWRAGEMERNSFRRIVWLRRFDQAGLNRTALAAEVATASQVVQVLKASNIVRNAAFGSEDGVPYMAWDYVPAQPLDQLMARAAAEQFPIAIDNALLIVEKLTAALAAAAAVEVQGQALIHGFLVPQLVMVGNDGEALVAGFGLARGLRSNLDRVAVKRSAAPYLAPEVLAGGPATRRSDVYSLGAILFQLLSGAALPEDPAARAAALEHPTLAFEEGPVPADVLAIFSRTLAERPEDRFPGAAEFKRELEKLLYGGNYSPTTFNLALFMDRLYRNEIEADDREVQHERSLDIAAHYQPPTPEQPPTVAAPPRAGKGMLAAIIGGAVVLLGVIGYLVTSRPSAPPPVDQEAQKKMLQELVNTQVAQALKEKEDQLRKELEAEKAKTEELRKQLAAPPQGPAAKQVSSAEQQRLQQELAAREAEQKSKEEELAKIKQQQAAEAAKARQQQQAAAARLALQPTAVPTATAASAVAPAPVAPTASAPPSEIASAAPAVRAAAPTPELPVTATGLGSGARAGDLVDFAQVDVPPRNLVETKVTLPRTTAFSRAPVDGYVILKVLVDEKGGVDDAQVLRGLQPPRPDIVNACIEAAKRNRYRPAMKDGKPVKTWITVTYHIVIKAGT